MQKSVSGGNRYSYVTFASCTVVVDNDGNVIVSCPTEDEAVEFIRELEEYDERI